MLIGCDIRTYRFERSRHSFRCLSIYVRSRKIATLKSLMTTGHRTVTYTRHRNAIGQKAKTHFSPNDFRFSIFIRIFARTNHSIFMNIFIVFAQHSCLATSDEVVIVLLRMGATIKGKVVEIMANAIKCHRSDHLKLSPLSAGYVWIPRK